MAVDVPSFGRAATRDRRIYRIDQWVIPLPGGVPLAGAGWALGLVLVQWVTAHTPGLGAAARAVGWPAWMVVVPLAAATALSRRTSDGRSMLVVGSNAARWLMCRAWSRAGERQAGTAHVVRVRVAVAGDHTCGTGTSRVHGPCTVTLAGPVVVRHKRGGRIRASAAELGAAGSVGPVRVVLEVGQQLELSA